MSISQFQTTELNTAKTNPTLRDAFDAVKKEVFLGLNCHALGTIQLFNSITQTVNVTINYKKVFLKSDPLTGIISQVMVDYPVLMNCPIVILQGGNAALTMPIAIGDTCLILFNDRDMDAWLASGQVGPCATQRLHSFSDGIALVGVRSSVNPVLGYDPIRTVLKNGLTKIRLGNKVDISNEATDLKTVLDGLCDLLATAFNAITPLSGTVFTEYKTTIEELLG